MKFLEPVKIFINKLDQRTFYIYLIIYSSICVALCALIIIYYYISIASLEKKIKNIDEYRDEVHAIMEKYAIIKQQQTAVEEILAKDPNFKIAETFGKFLAELNLTDKEDKPRREINITDLEENYRKIELNSHFKDMTMQNLTLLLEKIEQNPRIAMNRLEITKSKDKSAIQVSLTISTLLPKIEGTAT